ncbi:hypothetical protein LX36DRAFT_105246 [Colletotrichum falcatum]|nr:hypothetical protein LX36DRAFT_105246 [Colletotrichum falcatum]
MPLPRCQFHSQMSWHRRVCPENRSRSPAGRSWRLWSTWWWYWPKYRSQRGGRVVVLKDRGKLKRRRRTRWVEKKMGKRRQNRMSRVRKQRWTKLKGYPAPRMWPNSLFTLLKRLEGVFTWSPSTNRRCPSPPPLQAAAIQKMHKPAYVMSYKRLLFPIQPLTRHL